ncbi:MAG: DNA polymerase III subunit delta', partial [Enterococcus sp.]|nr:DNA polymerase III subunit delta' [Enterococcus sp.]
AEGEHPNIRVIRPDGQSIKVDQIRQLQQEFTKKGFEKGRQIFVLQEAEKLNTSAANSLLKFLEEPDGDVLFILETQNLGKIIPTIQSRCQIIHFYPLSSEKIKQQLEENGFSKENAKLLVSLTNSYQKAVEISQDEWFNCAKDVVLKWFNYLNKKDSQAFVYVQKNLLAIGKEKEQQQRILLFLLTLFQERRDEQLQAQLSVLSSNQAMELILQAQKKLAANVSFQNVVEQLSLRILFD